MEREGQVGTALLDEAKRYVDAVWEDVIEDIRSLVAVESVEDFSTAADGAPFGAGPAEALGHALAIAERLGLDPVNLEGYVDYGELKGARD